MSEEDRLDFVTGQVHALKGALMALIEANSNPAELLQCLQRSDQASQARVEAVAVSEEFLNGRAEVFEKLNAFTEKMVELRKKKS